MQRVLINQIRSQSNYIRFTHKNSFKTVNLNKNAFYLITCNRTPLFVEQKALMHLSSRLCKEPETKIDKAVDILKTETQEKSEQASSTTSTQVTPQQQPIASSIVPRPSLWQRIVHELKHYYNGSKLLYFETKIASRLFWKKLKGHNLTRREQKQFTKTCADLFRLVPFSLFVIVPFLEFTLPIFLKLFPNMLPSTFQEESKEQEKLRKILQAKIEMAKFLQDTLEETALTGSDKPKEETLNHKFAEFMKQIRSKGVQPPTEEIMKYSALFENELTLDNLNRQQLLALCKILEVSTYANIPTNDILRFQLRLKMRDLEADDRVILMEGVDSLDIYELQQACRDRGMRALGVSEARLRAQLDQWLDLHINRKIPTSLLILSRALYLPENLPPEELIRSTINALPNTIENATVLKIAEASGVKVDNALKLELLKREEEAIRLEIEQMKKLDEENAAKRKKVEVQQVPSKPTEAAAPATASTTQTPTPVDVAAAVEAARVAKEELIDKAQILTDKAPQIEIKEAQELLTPKEIKDIGQIIETLTGKDKVVKDDIAEIKKEFKEYKQDLSEVEKLTKIAEKPIKLAETKSAKILSRRVEKLINEMDQLIVKLEKDDKAKAVSTGAAVETSPDRKNMVSIDELIAAIRHLQGLPSEFKDTKIAKILESLDKDHDGKIDDLNDVIKVFELLAAENVTVSKDQLGKVLELLEKEKMIEVEEIEKRKTDEQQEQQQQQQQEPTTKK